MNYINPLRKINGFFAYIYILFCSLLMSLLCTNNPFQIGYTLIDSSVFTYVAKVIVAGGMPYRDTFDHKGPLIYLIDALGLLINEQIGIWIVEVITLFIIFLYTYKIASLLRCGSLLSCFVVTVGVVVFPYYFQGGNLTEEYSCAFIIISLYYFLKIFIDYRFERCAAILCGISFASVSMLRINMISLWIVMGGVIILEHIIKKRKMEFYRFVFWFSVAAAFVFIPILLWLIVNNAFYDFIRDYFIFNFRYSSDPVRASMSNIITAIKFFLMKPPLMVIFLICFLCIKDKRNTDWLCMITLFLSVVFSCISGQRFAHYGMSWYPLIIYMVSRVLFELSVSEESFCQSDNKRFRRFSYYICLCLCFLLAYNTFFAEHKIDTFFTQNSSFVNHKKIASTIQSLTDEDDKISVVGNANIFYLLSNRKSASKYSYQLPIGKIHPNIWKEYYGDIAQLKAKLIILPKKNRKNYPYNEIMKIVGAKYDLVAEQYGWEIYLLK